MILHLSFVLFYCLKLFTVTHLFQMLRRWFYNYLKSDFYLFIVLSFHLSMKSHPPSNIPLFTRLTNNLPYISSVNLENFPQNGSAAKAFIESFMTLLNFFSFSNFLKIYSAIWGTPAQVQWRIIFLKWYEEK